MTAEELYRMAARVSEEGNRVGLLVLADAMEELGDARAGLVREHARCCLRGLNIAWMLKTHQGLEPEWDEDWPPGCCLTAFRDRGD